MVCNWEAQQRGRPTARIDVHMEAGFHWKPSCAYMRSLTQQEAR